MFVFHFDSNSKSISLNLNNLSIIIIYIILQTNPEARPTLDQTLQHSFFTGPGTYIPDQLPESALRVPPLFQNALLSEGLDINRKGFRSDKGVILI